mmetsp:Transcript_26739/g.45622  ORF Transcript_26739/g.45622 Transcript_26739/m.45622 type:complete len:144 (-) Transcript_26739:8-439(-)
MTTPSVHPLWTRVLSATASIADVTAATIEYATEFAATVRDQRALVSQEERQDAPRFEAPDTVNDSKPIPDKDSVESIASFSKHLESDGKRLFGTPSLRPNKHEVVHRILFDEMNGSKFMIVDRTSGGKSLMVFVFGVSVGGTR